MSEPRKILKMSGLLGNAAPAKDQAPPPPAPPFAALGLPGFAPSPAPAEAEAPVMLPLDLIDRSPYQNRSPAKAERVETLAAEIRRHGLNNPVIVRPAMGGRYELVSGETRVAAYRLNGETHVPAFVRPMDDGQSARSLVLDNFHHEDLSDYEIYKGLNILRQVLQESGKAGSLAEIAELTPWGKSQVHRLMSFAKLPRAALDALEAQPAELGSQAASELAKLADAGTGDAVLTEAVRRILAGQIEQGKAAEWAAAAASRQAAPGASKPEQGKPSPRSVRAITTENGRLVCTLERTPKGFSVKGAKGIDWAKLEDELAAWLLSKIEN
jgi:ParB/RepB/Spo0J family partition protein